MTPTPVTELTGRAAGWPTLDQAAWQRALLPGDFLADGNAASTWRPASIKASVGAYSRWLAWLKANDRLDEATDPADRITRETAGAYAAHLVATCASVTVASYLGIFSMMVQAMFLDREWGWLRRLQSSMQRRAEPSRDKRAKIVPVSELLKLGLDLMAEAESLSVTALTPKLAVQYRDGFMIALLAARPLRQLNFVGMELGRHLTRTGAGYAIHFAAAETKTGRSIETSYPVDLLPALARYLERYRPYLVGLRQTRGRSRQAGLDAAGTRLWVTQYGAPMTAWAQYNAFGKHTVARFGQFVNPHLFRDCAATSLAIEAPDQVHFAAQLLGHKNFDTTEKYYIMATGRQATRHYHDRLAAIRNKPPRARRPAGHD